MTGRLWNFDTDKLATWQTRSSAWWLIFPYFYPLRYISYVDIIRYPPVHSPKREEAAIRFSPRTNIAVITPESTALLTLLATLAPRLSPVLNHMEKTVTGAVSASPADTEKKYTRWADLDATSGVMKRAFRHDVDTAQPDIHLDWVSLLIYPGIRYGRGFSKYSSKDMTVTVDRLLTGESMDDIAVDMKYHSYYLEAYTTALGGLMGAYQTEILATKASVWVLEQVAGEFSDMFTSVSDDCVWIARHRLEGFSPAAKSYPYSDLDDFDVIRNYDFERQHLDYDVINQVGTPVIAVESGYTEATDWNQYGGWRLGIHSFDGKRYYYYAYLRKSYPYHKTLREGSVVQAGDVIGHLDHTEYSRIESTNNIDELHLHFGLQLIFDESQKEGNNGIWVNCYELTKSLAVNRSETIKNREIKEYYRVYQMRDPVVPGGAVE